MHAALAEVTERDAAQVHLVQQRVEVLEVGPQVVRGNGGVLPPGPCLTTARKPGHDPRTGLADAPQRAGLGGIAHDHGIHHGLLDESRKCPGRLERGLLGVRAHLAVEPAAALGELTARVLLTRAGAQGVQQVRAHALDRGDALNAELRSRGGRRDRVREAEHRERREARLGHEFHGEPGDDPARSLGPGERLGHVETVLAQQVVQSVPGDLAGELTQFGAQHGQVPVPQLRQLGIQRGVRGAARVQGDLAPVGEHDRE